MEKKRQGLTLGFEEKDDQYAPRKQRKEDRGFMKKSIKHNGPISIGFRLNQLNFLFGRVSISSHYNQIVPAMNPLNKDQLFTTLLRGNRNRYEGYPEWYEQELAKNQPIPLSKFNGNLQGAVKFFQNEVGKLSFANSVLNIQLKAANEEKEQLTEWIEKLEETEKESYEEKKKRIRRCASQIERKFICQVENCDKSYGTEGSMAQHMRLKHPEIQYNGICSEIKLPKEDNRWPKTKESFEQAPQS